MNKQRSVKFIVTGENKYRFSALNFEVKKEKGVEMESDENGNFKLNMGNKTYKGQTISKTQNKYVVEVNGNFYSFSIDLEDTVKRTKPLLKVAGQNKTISIKSPMPGKIKEIFVAEGSEIKKGEPILILEAMKMQNQVLASSDARVLQVKVKEDQTVLGDQELITLQPQNQQ